MAGAANTFDGGTPGTSITPANSGGASGTPFSAANTSYAATPGMQGAACAIVPALNAGWVEHPLSGTGTRWVRAYNRPSDYSFGLVDLHLANGNYIRVDVNDGFIALTSSNGSAETWVASQAFTPEGWMRVELQASASASSTATARIYTDPDSETPAIQLTGVVASGGTWRAARYGGSNDANAAWYFDSVAWSDTGWIGPLHDLRPQPVIRSGAAHRAASW
ncbi:hypothetical protein ACIBKY_51000 [Nonomuraea sp. NPDC050394]|uniref:hypothetical protein n=1 Tax=Nonomuraea sp. NPDC050394 TaxID=3364363 RepID=UPI00378A962F